METPPAGITAKHTACLMTFRECEVWTPVPKKNLKIKKQNHWRILKPRKPTKFPYDLPDL